MPAIDSGLWDTEQRKLAEEIIHGPRGSLLPPFEPLLRSPELMAHAQKMGEYLRYRSAIGPRLSELAILITARNWSQEVEWAIHAPIAEQQGISKEAIIQLNHYQKPVFDLADEEVVYEFCQELHQKKTISDATWHKAIALFGERGVIDLIGINGYYTFLSMIMNASQTPAPESTHSLL
ncbi:carboxymuconolactone decarboxylase family protein [Brenneria sp. MC1SB4.1]|uniref:Carboxymuconolactone decarboxylase family protein n=2 Tax=Brenneria tiliae TaxID=2914984 RepID=A0ABT0MX38_9GAMM|nr:carboxymuconolactone decarboxylase family protein [Brenneria tiliae]MCL2894408.1 carboxymuconolactone decarboxylase family protein [Brenneria tiliae]